MSLECGECERDMRGPHANWCSRNAFMHDLEFMISDHIELRDENRGFVSTDKERDQCAAQIMRLVRIMIRREQES